MEKKKIGRPRKYTDFQKKIKGISNRPEYYKPIIDGFSKTIPELLILIKKHDKDARNTDSKKDWTTWKLHLSLIKGYKMTISYKISEDCSLQQQRANKGIVFYRLDELRSMGRYDNEPRTEEEEEEFKILSTLEKELLKEADYKHLFEQDKNTKESDDLSEEELLDEIDDIEECVIIGESHSKPEHIYRSKNNEGFVEYTDTNSFFVDTEKDNEVMEKDMRKERYRKWNYFKKGK